MATPAAQWVVQSTAASHLLMSERSLLRLRNAGVLRHGKHWRYALPSRRSRVLYYLELCEKELIKAAARDAHTLEQDIKLAR